MKLPGTQISLPTRMSVAIFLAIACASLAQAQEGEIIVPDNNITQCIKDMVQWCDSMQYPQQGAGMAILSITYEDPSGYYRVFCSSDSDGTNCTRNRAPWFACTPDHILTYKGLILSQNISTNVDYDICKTADKAFNELFVQNLSYDNTTLKNEVQKGLEAFFEQIAAMQEQIELIEKKLNGIFRDDFGGGMYDSFLFRGPDATTTTPNGDKSNSTELINQTGKE